MKTFRNLDLKSNDVIPVRKGSAFVAYGSHNIAFIFVRSTRKDCGNCCLSDSKLCDRFDCVNEDGTYFEALFVENVSAGQYKNKGFRKALGDNFNISHNEKDE